MTYHLFRKEVLSKGKLIKKWYYWFYDADGIQVQRVCKGCLTKAQAEEFISNLPELSFSQGITVAQIARDMFVPKSNHMKRREQMGKSIKPATILEWRRYCNTIVENFGSWDINKLTVKVFMDFLLESSKSTSWKNHLINVMTEIYKEAVWIGVTKTVPAFQTFKQKYKKADVFTDDEIKAFIQRGNFNNETEYLLFLLTLTAGLRISEARGFRPCQLSATNNVVYVDGFLDTRTQRRTNYCKSGTEDNPKWRVAIIPSRTAIALREYFAKNNITPSELAFQHAGNVYRPEHVRDLFKRALEAAGIEKETEN